MRGGNMPEDRSAAPEPGRGVIGGFEHELTLHLERAHELGERVKRANTAVEEQLRRTRQIADELKGVAAEGDGPRCLPGLPKP